LTERGPAAFFAPLGDLPEKRPNAVGQPRNASPLAKAPIKNHVSRLLQQRSHERDESSEVDISELSDSLRRTRCLFPAPSGWKNCGKPALRRRAEQTYQQLDFLMGIRKETRKELWRKAGRAHLENTIEPESIGIMHIGVKIARV